MKFPTLSFKLPAQPAQPLSQEQKLRSLGRGFAGGIVLSLGVAGCLLLGIHMTNAQGMVDPADDSTSQQTMAAPTPAPTPSPAVSSGPFSNNAPTATPAPSRPVNSNGGYMALGDSVAAGLGLPASASPSASDSQCGRSPQAYAYQVAAAVGKRLSHVACSGATAGDLFTKQGVNGPNITPQLDQAYANGNKPSLITLTAGANDVQWSTFVQKCYAATCGTSFDTAVLKASLAALEAKLYYAFYSIQVRSGTSTPPRVVATGYYNPLSSQCVAVSQGKLTANEVTWVTNSLNSLNRTIQSVAAKFDFVRYAAVNFSGHDLCSADSWIQGQADPAPIHPTAAGQSAIARSVIAAARQQ